MSGRGKREVQFFKQPLDQIALNYFYCNISLIILIVPFRQLLLSNFMSTSSHWSISSMSDKYMLRFYFDVSPKDKLTVSNFSSMSTLYLP